MEAARRRLLQDELVLDMVSQVILDVSEKLPAKRVLASLVRQSKVTHFIERGLAEEFDDVHA